MNRLIAQVTKFLSSLKKSKSLPDKEKILSQQYSLEVAKEKVEILPSKQEIEDLSELDKSATGVDKELDALFSTKFAVQAPTQAAAATLKPETANTPVPETAVSSMPPATKQDPVSEAIGGIKLVKEQIQESHQLLLTSNEVGPKEHKMIGKVQKLISHMNEAIDWLTQRNDGEGGLLAVSSVHSSALSDRQSR